jgi:hypothetical protein
MLIQKIEIILKKYSQYKFVSKFLGCPPWKKIVAVMFIYIVAC